MEVIKLEGVGHSPEDAIMPRDMFLLQVSVTDLYCFLSIFFFGLIFMHQLIFLFFSYINGLISSILGIGFSFGYAKCLIYDPILNAWADFVC